MTNPPPTAPDIPDKPAPARSADLETLLRGYYWCGRDWQGWDVGTMTADDFTPAEECELVGDLIAWRDETARPDEAAELRAYRQAEIERPRELLAAELRQVGGAHLRLQAQLAAQQLVIDAVRELCNELERAGRGQNIECQAVTVEYADRIRAVLSGSVEAGRDKGAEIAAREKIIGAVLRRLTGERQEPHAHWSAELEYSDDLIFEAARELVAAADGAQAAAEPGWKRRERGIRTALFGTDAEVAALTAAAVDEDGSGPAEVWVPPASDCMHHRPDKPCPHCGGLLFHMRTGRCGDCGRRPTPTDGTEAGRG
jgi:hypothetical protein